MVCGQASAACNKDSCIWPAARAAIGNVPAPRRPGHPVLEGLRDFSQMVDPVERVVRRLQALPDEDLSRDRKHAPFSLGVSAGTDANRARTSPASRRDFLSVFVAVAGRTAGGSETRISHKIRSPRRRPRALLRLVSAAPDENIIGSRSVGPLPRNCGCATRTGKQEMPHLYIKSSAAISGSGAGLVCASAGAVGPPPPADSISTCSTRVCVFASRRPPLPCRRSSIMLPPQIITLSGSAAGQSHAWDGAGTQAHCSNRASESPTSFSFSGAALRLVGLIAEPTAQVFSPLWKSERFEAGAACDSIRGVNGGRDPLPTKAGASGPARPRIESESVVPSRVLSQVLRETNSRVEASVVLGHALADGLAGLVAVFLRASFFRGTPRHEKRNATHPGRPEPPVQPCRNPQWAPRCPARADALRATTGRVLRKNDRIGRVLDKSRAALFLQQFIAVLLVDTADALHVAARKDFVTLQ